VNNGFEFIKESIPDQKASIELMGRLYDVTQPNSVFTEPMTQGEYTVITASEVSVGLGYGYGGGGGSGSADEDEEGETGSATGYGGGGGGGGGAMARPVAVIELGPNGVRVEPIVDPTKIVLAFFTTFGAMFMMLNRMRKQARG
jgi:uncharacterized spore protein YtfJ